MTFKDKILTPGHVQEHHQFYLHLPLKNPGYGPQCYFSSSKTLHIIHFGQIEATI